MPSTQAILKAAAKYDLLGYDVDAIALDLIRGDAAGKGVACGKGWIPPTKKCSKEKAGSTPKDALKRTTAKQKERQKLRAEVEGRVNRTLTLTPRGTKPDNEIKKSGLTARRELLQQVKSWERSLEALGGEASEAVNALRAMDELKEITKEAKAIGDKARSRSTRREELDRLFEGKVSRVGAKVAAMNRRVFELLNPRRMVRVPKGTTQAEYANIVERLFNGDKAAIKQYTVPRKSKKKK